jgi:hypothetical protein
MPVGVDQAGEHDPVLRVHDLGVADVTELPDGGDAVLLDE